MTKIVKICLSFLKLDPLTLSGIDLSKRSVAPWKTVSIKASAAEACRGRNWSSAGSSFKAPQAAQRAGRSPRPDGHAPGSTGSTSKNLG